jgi:hypothetical protein
LQWHLPAHSTQLNDAIPWHSGGEIQCQRIKQNHCLKHLPKSDVQVHWQRRR